MEIAGGVASVISIAGAAATISKFAAQAFAALRDAPSEISGLRTNLIIIEDVLCQLSAFQSDVKISSEVVNSLGISLHAIELAITEILEWYKEITIKKSGLSRSIKWALFDKGTVDRLERQLQTRQIHLTTVIQLLFIRQHGFSNNRCEKVTTVIEKYDTKNAKTSATMICGQIPLISSITAAVLQRPQHLGRTYTKDLPWWLRYLGLEGRIVRVIRRQESYWRIHTRFYNYKHTSVVIADIVLFAQTKLWSLVPHISVLPIVPSDSEIIQTCAAGDVATVRRLFSTGQAGPHDTTMENLNLMFHAINSRNPILVGFLLSQGADPNQTFGENETSPLQWALHKRQLDICRLLVNWKADGAYVSALGWTPVFYLLLNSGIDPNFEEVSAFLRVLSCDSLFLDIENQDPKGLTILENVACHGTSDEIDALLKLGALLERGRIDPWCEDSSAIDYAIGNDNFETFLALLQHGSEVERVGSESYTMLHHAALLGRDKIVRYLLQEKGAKPFIPNYDPEADIAGHCVDCKDGIMKKCDEHIPWTRETYDLYLQALEDSGKIVVVRKNTGVINSDEIFWDCDT